MAEEQLYHISKNMTPEKCHAKPGNCPLGNQNHFISKENAQDFIDSIMDKQNDAKETCQKLLKNNSFLNESLYSETKDTMTYALINMEKPQSYFIDKSGEFYITSDGKKVTGNVNKRIKQAISRVKTAYTKIGRDFNEVKITSIFFDSKDKDYVIAQSAGEHCNDGLIIKDNKLDIIEAKHSSGLRGARMARFSTQVNSDGSIVTPTWTPSHIKEQIKNINTSEINNTIYNLKSINSKDSLEYFVATYRAKGATHIMYTDSQDIPHQVEIKSGETKDKAEELYKLGLRAQLYFETKNSPHPMTDADELQLKKLLESNSPSVWESKTSELGQLRKSKRIGRFIRWQNSTTDTINDYGVANIGLSGHIKFSPHTKEYKE